MNKGGCETGRKSEPKGGCKIGKKNKKNKQPKKKIKFNVISKAEEARTNAKAMNFMRDIQTKGDVASSNVRKTAPYKFTANEIINDNLRTGVLPSNANQMDFFDLMQLLPKDVKKNIGGQVLGDTLRTGVLPSNANQMDFFDLMNLLPKDVKKNIGGQVLGDIGEGEYEDRLEEEEKRKEKQRDIKFSRKVFGSDEPYNLPTELKANKIMEALEESINTMDEEELGDLFGTNDKSIWAENFSSMTSSIYDAAKNARYGDSMELFIDSLNKFSNNKGGSMFSNDSGSSGYSLPDDLGDLFQNYWENPTSDYNLNYTKDDFLNQRIDVPDALLDILRYENFDEDDEY